MGQRTIPGSTDAVGVSDHVLAGRCGGLRSNPSIRRIAKVSWVSTPFVRQPLSESRPEAQALPVELPPMWASRLVLRPGHRWSVTSTFEQTRGNVT